MAESTNPWGRVSDDGTVEVRLGDTWHAVGAYPDGTPEEALALFERKFADLEAQVGLVEQRVKAGAPAKDLTRSVKKLTEELGTPSSVGDIQSLRDRLAPLHETIDQLTAKQAEQREEAVAAAVVEREAIVASIEALAAKDPSSIRWKDATAQVDALFNQWKEHQKASARLPKNTADELWKRFKNAKNALERGKRTHFQERDKAAKAAKSSKREIIEKAEALAPKGADGIPAYRALLDEWKKAPRGNRQLEDQLWAQFKAAGDALYQAKNAAVEAEDAANAENGAAKQELIKEFSNILSMSDHREAVERIRLFHDRFRAIGHAPRSMVKALDAEVRKFDQHVKKLEAEHWEKTDPEKQARSQSFLGQIDDQIATLEAQKADAEQAGDSKKAAQLASEIETKVAWKAVLTEA